MPPLLLRLWQSSPERLTQALLRRLRPSQPSASPAWHRVRSGPLEGVEILVAPADPTDMWSQMIAGTWDEFLFAHLGSAPAAKGEVVWDVGSHVGYHALRFAAQRGPDTQVVAFEPNPVNQERIREHLSRNRALGTRIRLEARALSDTTGTAEFRFHRHMDSGMSTGSHLSVGHAPRAEWEYRQFETATVPTVTIDHLIEQEGAPEPAILKIDVEGAESRVLAGGRRFLSRRRPLLLVEVHHILEMLEVARILMPLGYAFEVLDEAHAEPGRCFVVARA